ncbi:hypothetical protein HKX48_000632 [Thoreauomyces humboldtii]|nr:hypothetical protein HKX48_000632 [Thoreauomyces humboldtii]
MGVADAAVAQNNIKAIIARRYNTKSIGTVLYVGQKVRLKRIISRFEKPGRQGFFEPDTYTVVSRFNSTYQNILPSYRIADASGSVKQGRIPKSNLLPIPPILSHDEYARGSSAAQSPSQDTAADETDEAPNTIVQQTQDTVDTTPRRSLRVQNQQQEDDGEYEIDHIVGHRTFRRVEQFRVRYTGYGSEDDQWRPADEVEQLAPELVAEYKRIHHI